MKEFILLFRNADNGERPSPEQLQTVSKAWMDWMGSIAAQNKLANRGNRLTYEGATVLPNNVVTDGPYAELKEILSGYIVIQAGSMKEAIEISKGCPILTVGGNVEIRTFAEINV
jgi:hypothetical protein